jgi:hypothetical protein
MVIMASLTRKLGAALTATGAALAFGNRGGGTGVVLGYP